MERFLAYLRLIRIVNLIITALTLVCFKYFVIEPVMQAASLQSQLSVAQFSMLTLATVIIAAAGNIINDFFDFDLDREFKPDRQVLGKHLSLDTAYTLSFSLYAIGIAAGFYLAWQVNNIKLGYLFVLAAVLLWFYSYLLKRTLLIGNLVVAILCALPLIVLVAFEYMAFANNTVHAADAYTEGLVRTVIRYQLTGYAFFAFLITLIREIVKDMQDMVGDGAHGCRTLPVTFGFSVAKSVILILLIATIGIIGWLQYTIYFRAGAMRQFWYLVFAVQFALFISFISMLGVTKPRELPFISLMLKFAMLLGILTMPLFHYWQ